MRVDPAGAELGWYDERLGGSGSSAACCGPRPGAAGTSLLRVVPGDRPDSDPDLVPDPGPRPQCRLVPAHQLPVPKKKKKRSVLQQDDGATRALGSVPS